MSARGCLSIAILIAVAVGCGTSEGDPHETGGAEAPEPPAAPTHTAERAMALDPASACGRALECCRAYAAAMPDVVADVACAGPAEAAGEPDADGRCEAMTEGWREVLRLLPDTEPPPACARR